MRINDNEMHESVINGTCEAVISEARESVILEVIKKYNTTPHHGEQADRFYMSAALELAGTAASMGEVPVGCVIVHNDKIIAADFNGREAFGSAVYHAETAAISKACAVLGGWRLIGCTLYVTLEPCPMCAGAVWNARIPRVVIGAKDSRAGAFGSLINLNSYPLNHKPELVFGVCEREASELMRQFFMNRRKK